MSCVQSATDLTSLAAPRTVLHAESASVAPISATVINLLIIVLLNCETPQHYNSSIDRGSSKSDEDAL
jgi:hypothetical protein